MTLTATQMPTHNHGVSAVDDDPGTGIPTNTFLADTNPSIYAAGPPSTTMASGMISPAGGNGTHPNLQPYPVMNYIVCLSGIFPSRN